MTVRIDASCSAAPFPASCIPEGLDLGALQGIFARFRENQAAKEHQNLKDKFGPEIVAQWDAQRQLGIKFKNKCFISRLFQILYPSEYTKCVSKNHEIYPLADHQWSPWVEGPTFRGEYVIDSTGEKRQEPGKAQFIIDKVTGEPSLNEDNLCIEKKMALIFFGTVIPVVPLLYACATIGYFAFSCIELCGNLWQGNVEKCLESLGKIVKAVARAVLLPFIVLGFFGIAVHGLLDCPKDARQLYAALERLVFDDHYVLAPCFQPYPTMHFFGDDLATANGM